MTRAEAKCQGLRYYDPGRPCPKGHTALYTTVRGCCVECQRIANARPENKARRATYAETEAGKEATQRAKINYRATGRGQAVEQEYKRAYRPRENVRARERYEHRGYRKLSNSYFSRKRLSHILPGDLKKVQTIYTGARILGLEVDHIIPLRGVNVCGLHTLCNLQLLTKSEHRVKTLREYRAWLEWHRSLPRE